MIMAFDLFVFDSVEVPTEKRAKRWAISIEDLVTDQTGNDCFDVLSFLLYGLAVVSPVDVVLNNNVVLFCVR